MAGAKLIFKKKTKKAVEFADRISAEQVAILVQKYLDFAIALGYATGTELEDIEELRDIATESLEVKEFDLMFETEFGKGYLIGILMMTLRAEEMFFTEEEEEDEEDNG